MGCPETRTLPATSRLSPKITRPRVFQSFFGHTFSSSLHIIRQSCFRCSDCVGFSALGGFGVGVTGAGGVAGVGEGALEALGSELWPWYLLANKQDALIEVDLRGEGIAGAQSRGEIKGAFRGADWKSVREYVNRHGARIASLARDCIRPAASNSRQHSEWRGGGGSVSKG